MLDTGAALFENDLGTLCAPSYTQSVIFGQVIRSRASLKCLETSGRIVRNLSKLGLAHFALLIPAFSFSAETAPCQRVKYEQGGYTVCEVDLRRQSVRLFWKKPDGHLMDILPRYHELWATQDASFSRQTVACTTRTALQLACTSRRVGSSCKPTRTPVPATSI